MKKSLLAILVLAVIIGGVYLWQKEAQAPSVGKIEGWQTYSNPQFGFSLQMPTTFITATYGEISFCSDSEGYCFSVNQTSLNDGQNLEDWVITQGVAKDKIKEIVIGNHRFLTWMSSHGMAGGTAYSLLRNNQVFTADIADPTPAEQASFEKILSTLEFIN